MHNKPLNKRTPAQIAEAIQRAKDYAAAQDVPLTAERLAAELDMDLLEFHRIATDVTQGKTPAVQKKMAMIQRACAEATASVVEHAMRRGSGTNMHLLYLKNNAGYDAGRGDKGTRDAGDGTPPVVFIGEESLTD